MPDNYAATDRTRFRQLREKGSYDRAAVHGILDAALYCSAAFVQDGQPVVVPMIHGRDEETIYLHGARKARVIRLLETTEQVCLNATLVDGIVLARSAFNSSMNYRSVTVFGAPRLVDDEAEKLHGMRVISEHLMPGRWDELRGYATFADRFRQSLPTDAGAIHTVWLYIVKLFEVFGVPLFVGSLPWTVLGAWLGYRWSLKVVRIYQERRDRRRARRAARREARLRSATGMASRFNADD